MERFAPHLLLTGILLGLWFGYGQPSACAQSQALNGQIEGAVLDRNGAAIANAHVTVTNLETGAARTAETDANGLYRFPLLPLGMYRVTSEAPNFKKLIHDGVTIGTGQTATVNLRLEPGDVQEVITVAADSSITDIGTTDVGRVMNTREVRNLPLVTRNPYTLVLLQANVTGRPNRGFNFPAVNANGYLRRVNYQLDGNTNTQADRAGVRLMTASEIYVSEVQLITNGFAAEFGNTPGIIMNIVTPSGTNDLTGTVAYLFRRPPFYSRPFFYSSPNDLPDNETDDVVITLGGPIIKDRWHFYSGYENIKRVDNTRANRLVTITDSNKDQLIGAGVPASIFPASIPSLETGSFYIFRTDVQLNDNNRLTARFNHSDGRTENNIQGGLNTLERSVDVTSPDYSFGIQLVSYTSKFLNELRFQYVHRKVSNQRNGFSGSGPSIAITSVANFGSPEDADTVGPRERVAQVQDNLTWTQGTHEIKFGGGSNFVDDFNRSGIFSTYTFPSITAYLAANSGTDPFRYDLYTQTFGEPDAKYSSTFWNAFAQDDWRFSRRLKVNFGLRYDLYAVPKADPSSPFPASQSFKIDKANFAPRLGVVYALREGDRPLVLRAGAGLYYEAPWLNMYGRALLKNGNAKFFSIRFSGDNGGTRLPDPLAPPFPNTFSGSLTPDSLPKDIDTIAPDFENMYAIHSNIQLEQAITQDLSVAIGYVHSGGRHIPVYRNINLINPTRFLADGRGVFSRTVNASTRLDPRFNIIQMAESVGLSRYDAFTVQLKQRLSRGIQFNANYTLSRALDDAPEQNAQYALSTTTATLVRSDPFNGQLDKGNSFADQRHSFVMSLVARPTLNLRSRPLHRIVNNNQFSFIAFANSGERFNIVADRDLNLDGIFGAGITNSDRPVGIKRNSGTTPPQFNLDLRYSRFFNFRERYKVEAFGEFQNLFNINCIVSFNNVTVPTDPLTGELIGALPDFKSRNQLTSQESRQVQLGVKFYF